MAFKNKIAAKCKTCGVDVPFQMGWSYGPPWYTKCAPCSGEVETAVRISVTLDGSNVLIKANGSLGDKFGTFRTACEGARYNGSHNVIAVGKAVAIIERLRAAGFGIDISNEVVAALKSATAQTVLGIQAAADRTEEVDAILRARGKFLYPFQKTGISWLASKYGALLADDMGLGKTIQLLTALPPNAGVVVICPAVAKGVWQREAAAWCPERKVTIFNGRGSFRWPAPNEIVITNPDILPEAKRVGFDNVLNTKDADSCPAGIVLIADEAQWLTVSKTVRSIRFRAMSSVVRNRNGRTWLATATPIINKAPELWSILTAAGLQGEAFGSWNQFAPMLGGYQGQWGMEWALPPNPAAVGERLKRVMLRRMKSEVLPELPVKTYREIPVEIDARTTKLCDSVLADMAKRNVTLESLANSLESGTPLFSQMSRVRAALAAAKVNALLQIVADYEEQQEPLVVFSAHVAPIEALANREGWATITGDTPPAERTSIEDRFQRGELKGVACTIKAGGVAITLTRASHSLFVDLGWTPSENAQAEDRICRISQNRGCIISTLVASHPLDQRVFELLAAKREIIANSVEQGRADASPVVISVATTDFDKLLADAKAQAAAADQAKAAAAKIAAERAEQFAGREEKAEQERKDRAERERTERRNKKNADRRLANAKSKGWVEEEEHPERRGPKNARECWAAQALATLSSCDPDFAAERNDIGFNRPDAAIGHWLTEEMSKGLTPKQWAVVIALCSGYPRQVGSAPAEETACEQQGSATA